MVRPHPDNSRYYEDFQEDGVIVWPRKGNFPGLKEEICEFYNSVYYSVATIGVNTSGMIDAMVINKPCITIMTEQYKKSQLMTAHFPDLIKAEVLNIAKDIDECADLVAKILKGDDSTKDARLRFIKEFTRPRGLDIPAGQVAATVIEMLGSGESPKEIDLALHAKSSIL